MDNKKVLVLVFYKGEDLTEGEGTLISLDKVRVIESTIDFSVEIL